MTQHPPTQSPRRRRGRVTSVQITFAAFLAIGLLLTLSFSSRITAGQPLESFRDEVMAEIEALREEQARLIAEREYALSDAFVEAWARSEGKMVREGEILIIPVPVQSQLTNEPIEQVPLVNIVTEPPSPEPWTLWWSLFFDSPPPQ